MKKKYIIYVYLIVFMNISLQLMAGDSYTSNENDRFRKTYEQSHESGYQDQNSPQKDQEHFQQSVNSYVAASVSAAIKELTISFVEILSLLAGLGSGAFIGGKSSINGYPVQLAIFGAISLTLIIPIGTQYFIVTYWE